MTRNRSRRNLRLNVEVVESRCLLSAADPFAGLVPIPAKTAAAFDSSTATVTAHDAIINASVTRLQYGVTGAGLTAAVIDTGVNYDHPAFGGGFGPGSVVKAGYDFGDNDADPREKNGSAHGTAVAGIIASREPTAPGVAPGADIAALRVFGDSGKGSFDGIADALQWVITHHKQHNISVVNLSISDGKNYQSAPTLFASPVVRRIIDLIDQLETLRIPVVTAAGNSFSGQQGMGFTAIVDNTISVTGSDGTSRLAPDAQRLGREAGGKFATDLAAPGRNVTGPWVGSSFAQLDGTSFAAPLVTGSVLLLQELYLGRFGQLPTVDQVEGWLRDSAAPMRDPGTGFTIGRLDLAGAAARVPRPAVVPSSPVRPTSPPRPTPPVVVTPPASGNVSRPSAPVAEPPANGGGSRAGSPSTGLNSTPKPPARPSLPADGGNSNNSGNDNTSSNGNGSTEELARPPVAPVSPPPTTPEPSPSPSPHVEPPSFPEPAPAPAPVTEAPPAEESRPVAPTNPKPVPVVVVDDALDAINDEDDDLGRVDDEDRDTEAPVGPIAEPVELPGRDDGGKPTDPRELLASLFSTDRPGLSARAWNVSRPGTPAVWERAQIFRSQRAEALASARAQRLDAAKPSPIAAASARSAAIEARSSTV